MIIADLYDSGITILPSIRKTIPIDLDEIRYNHFIGKPSLIVELTLIYDYLQLLYITDLEFDT